MMQNVMDHFLGKVDGEGKRGAAKREPPKEVLVYRQGISEGFYSMVNILWIRIVAILYL